MKAFIALSLVFLSSIPASAQCLGFYELKDFDHRNTGMIGGSVLAGAGVLALAAGPVGLVPVVGGVIWMGAEGLNVIKSSPEKMARLIFESEWIIENENRLDLDELDRSFMIVRVVKKTTGLRPSPDQNYLSTLVRVARIISAANQSRELCSDSDGVRFQSIDEFVAQRL